jgi:predicted enzyme related to lactoylglutathione lyase
MSNGTARKQIECVAPILSVADIAISTNYYLGSLGFKTDWEYRDGDFAISGISRDGHTIYLCEGPQGHPGTWVWIGVEDVDRLFEEFTANGALILKPPTNYPWAREMHVTDPDRHVLRIGSEPLEDQS